MFKFFYQSALSIVVMLMVATGKLSAQQSLWVGQTYNYDISSSVMGITANMSWSVNGGYIQLTGSGMYRNIKVTQYFSGTATVKCEWDYKLTSSGRYTHTSRSITIQCRENPVSISPSSLNLAPGETSHVSYRHQFSNEYTSAANAYFSSSNPSVATVSSNGTVTAKSPGTAYINVYSKISNAANAPYCTVTVKPVPPTSVYLASSTSLLEGTTKILVPSLYPSNAQTSYSWASSNTDIVTVSSGKITGIAPGKSKITVTTSNGLSASCNVEVVTQPKSIAFQQNEITLTAGYGQKISPQNTPASSLTTYSWRSSDTSIATVNSNGWVHAKSEGETTITCTTQNGHTASCTIVVKEALPGRSASEINKKLQNVNNLTSTLKNNLNK